MTWAAVTRFLIRLLEREEKSKGLLKPSESTWPIKVSTLQQRPQHDRQKDRLLLHVHSLRESATFTRIFQG